LHHFKELARIGAQALHITPLPFGIDRVERERRLPRPGKASDDDQFLARQLDIEALEIVLAGAANGNGAEGHWRRCGDWMANIPDAPSRTLLGKCLFLKCSRRSSDAATEAIDSGSPNRVPDSS